MAVNTTIVLYVSGWQNDELLENKRVPWILYPQAIWEVAIERCDKEKVWGLQRLAERSARPVYPWLPIEEKTRQEKAEEERLVVIDASHLYLRVWGWQNWKNEPEPEPIDWALYTRDIWEKAIARCEQLRLPEVFYPCKPVPPWMEDSSP